VVGAWIALELATFTTYAQREITGVFPGYFDQTGYIIQSYDIVRTASARGLPAGVRSHLGKKHATGLLLPLQGATHCVVLGNGRLALLSVNFLHFALFQCALVATLLWLTRNWWVALAGFGLTLTLKTVFQPAGGAFDFRMDFASFCLFGVFLCALVRSRLLVTPRGAAVVGAVGAVLVLFRFLTAVYIGALLGLLGAVLLARRLTGSDPESRSRLRGWLVVACGVRRSGTHHAPHPSRSPESD
jgi:hypothetical protein